MVEAKTEAEEFADRDPVTATILAWKQPTSGADELWHEECRAEVRKLIPILGESLDRLVALMMEFDEFEGRTKETMEGTEDVLQEDVLQEDVLQEEFLREDYDDIIVATQDNEPVFLDDADLIEEEEEESLAETDPVPDFNTATAETIGARGMRATMRMRAWGWRKENQKRRLGESRIREQIVAHLNNRSELSQKDIGAMVGVTSGRIAQIVREYYDRLDREKE